MLTVIIWTQLIMLPILFGIFIGIRAEKEKNRKVLERLLLYRNFGSKARRRFK